MAGISVELLLASLMVAATPILFAALGEMVVEKSGVLNLGVEGMMIVGAICGFATAVETGSPALGFLGAALGGAALALTLFGLGLSALIGQGYVGIKPPATARLDLGPLADIPFVGRVLFRHDALVYLGLGMTAAIWAFLRFTRAGLVLRAVGESHDAAHALGYKVVRIRIAAILFGGAMAGLGGAYLSLVRVPQWTEGMTAGAGWIALALVVFGAWRPGRVALGAYLFGGITVLQLNLQAAGVAVPVALLSISPYLITILVLVVMSSDRRRVAMNAPASLGRVFHATA